MVAGSYNTMSYLRPGQFWLRPFGFLLKSQTKDIHDQFGAGARAFDFRIAFKGNKPVFANGIATYDVDVYDTLEQINRWSRAQYQLNGSRIIVRIILERGSDHARFSDFCLDIDNRYSEIQFCGFRSKDRKFHTHWYIRDRCGAGIDDTGSIELDGKDWYYSSRPSPDFALEYKLRKFVRTKKEA